MRILFTLCGRAGSKGIKNKNIREFAGIKLPYYSLAALTLYCEAHQDNIEADIAVNTDSEELKALMLANRQAEVEFIAREEDLALDDTPKIAVILDCLNQMEKRKGKCYDMVVDMDITSPLRTVPDLERLVQRAGETECDLVFSVTSARRNPYFNMVKKTEYGYKRVLESSADARQQAPEVFDMNASLYAYKPAFLRKGQPLLSGRCEVIHMYDTAVLDLDDENDFELMEVIAGHLFETREDFMTVRKQAEKIQELAQYE
ncbi:MAG: acylneuraminate cytidylyltransferase family protein [Lachnospiraceae bacterium]|nr:acylneuraminate cytidylyltransferase family protein [Lachnospiraceae bacterium]